MTEIAASLWSVPVAGQLDTAMRLREAGVGRLHWDATDGRFAVAGGFAPERAAELTAAVGTAAEAHIMAERSAREVDAWTDFCDLVIVHAESADWQSAVDRIERRGCRPGLAISPRTEWSIVPNDMVVLCMAITPGSAGSPFDERVLRTIAKLRESSPARRIGIDGGVTRAHAERIIAAGGDWLVVGNDLVFHGEAKWADLLHPAP